MASAGLPSARGELPQVFGRYLLLRRLSRGGMGEIFLARLGEIQGFEKPVIIKKVLPQLAADEEFVRRFIDEAQVAIKLAHANIAPVYEVGKVDGDYFLAIEYVEGRDLRRLLARCEQEKFRLPPDLCLYIAREVANGLGYAHRRTDKAGNALALVHCDISPPNVMISFEGEVKIIDFGIAKTTGGSSPSDPHLGFGKFGYMAPEQLARGGVVDRRTDIYAAGVVLYELLTGQRLYEFPEGADHRQIARIVAEGQFLPPSRRAPGLDASLDAIVQKALCTRPQDRYQSAEELRDAIQARLSQINPTLSSDALSSLMRRLFADDAIKERALLAETRAVDVEDYRDELAGSVGHTVTFARAGMGSRRSERRAPSTLGERLGETSFLAGALVVFAILSGVAVTLLAARPRARALPMLAARPLPPPAIASPPAPDARTPTVAVAPAAPSGVASRPAPPPALPRHSSRRPPIASAPPAVVERAPPPEVAGPPTLKEEVGLKVHAFNLEYEQFRKAHGEKLGPSFNDFNSWKNYHHTTSDDLAEISRRIDDLRASMRRIREGD